MDQSHQAVIIDNGSFSIKGGFSSSDKPSAFLASKLPALSNKKEIKTIEISDDLESQNKTTLTYPIYSGFIYYWEEIEKL